MDKPKLVSLKTKMAALEKSVTNSLTLAKEIRAEAEVASGQEDVVRAMNEVCAYLVNQVSQLTNADPALNLLSGLQRELDKHIAK